MPNAEKGRKLIELIDEYKQSGEYKNKEEKESGVYKFIPLKKKDGFLVYSKEEYNNNNAKIKEFYSDYENLEEKYLHRFYYYEQLQNNNSPDEKILTIIMLNPAFADSTEPDKTISNIEEKFLKLKQIEKYEFTAFEIINLYSVRMPKSAKLNEILKKLGVDDINLKLNEEFTKSFIDTSCDENPKRTLLAAWGASYHNKAMKRFNGQRPINCYALTEKTKCPRHFSSCSYNRVDEKDINIKQI